MPVACEDFDVVFFSSRRRHTRFDCDWSSDVCSSDLGGSSEPVLLRHARHNARQQHRRQGAPGDRAPEPSDPPASRRGGLGAMIALGGVGLLQDLRYGAHACPSGMTIGGVGGATRRMLYSTGTTTRGKHVATSSPPDTARASGAFCSPPSPRPNAIGSIPMIMASAVMQTGRSRTEPALRAASKAESPARRWSSAKVMSRTLFAVATPKAMMLPINDGTLNVVWVTNSIHTMPHSAPGSAITITRGSSHD